MAWYGVANRMSMDWPLLLLLLYLLVLLVLPLR
jgi:hypothetical protein